MLCYLIDLILHRRGHHVLRTAHTLRGVVVLVRIVAHRVVGLAWKALLIVRRKAGVRITGRGEARPDVRKMGLKYYSSQGPRLRTGRWLKFIWGFLAPVGRT